MSTPTVPQAAIDLILNAEGIDQPGRWPQGDSGVTLGYGCDIGADPESLSFWRGVLTDHEVDRLQSARGITGPRAGQIAHQFADIHVTREQALRVFNEHTLPREVQTTLRAFPGAEQLPPAAFGALVSLVFNRGPALSGSRRAEMAKIHEILADGVQKGDTQAIAAQLREMKHLWRGQGLDGLITRREAEARLVESTG